MWPKEKIYKNTTSECQLLFMRPLVVPEPGHPFHMGKFCKKLRILGLTQKISGSVRLGEIWRSSFHFFCFKQTSFLGISDVWELFLHIAIVWS